ncbi:MAG TPA: DUF3943 domain-containing protein [Haliangium sp.]|nr:DUF3943 domain-containing protein [Haliangium sp.]
MTRGSRIVLVALLLAAALRAPARADQPAPLAPCRLGDRGCFLDPDGAVRDADQAYRALHRRARPHYARAAVEMAALLGIGTAWYWIDRERQVADWDFPSLKQRFTLDAVRFDNNDFWINFLAHPLDGAAAHALARANHLTLAESFGYSLLTSLAWEYGLEFREKVSVNDIIVTPVTGVVVGEFLHRLGQSLNAPRPPGTERWWHQLAGWTFGTTVAIHDALDATHSQTSLHAARADVWRDLHISYGWAESSVDADGNGADGADGARAGAHALRFDGRLVAIPGYLRPGRFHRAFADADITALRLDLGLGGAGGGVDLHADTMLLGVHGQRISSQGTGPALAIGASLAIRYANEALGPWKDQLGIAHLPGLGADAHVLGRHASLRVHARVHGDFAGLRAAPYSDWKAANPDVVDKSILRKQGYYYGWGWSARAGAELTTPFASLGGEIFHGQYASHEGLDRVQEQITADVEVESAVLDAELWLRLPLPARLYAELAAQSRRRRTQVDTHEDTSRLDRVLFRLGMDL